MSNYLGIEDFVPQLTPFNPNLNYYSGVLATKQQQYDTGLAKVNSIYSSALAQPLTRDDNNMRREDYFKTITQDIQKIAKLDLSKDENVNIAKQLFAPVVNDKAIIFDMYMTKKANDAFEVGNRFRSCSDPDKCNGEFWEPGMQAIKYKMEEFKNASPSDAMNFDAPDFVPFQNVTKKSIDAAKKAGFNVSFDHNEGRYIVTDTNGQLLFGQHGDGVLPQFLMGMFGNDSGIQSMYSTQAYVQRKNSAKQLSATKGISEDQAESEYLHNIIARTTPRLERSKQDLSELKNKMEVDQKALEVQVKQQGGVLPGDPALDQYERLMQLTEAIKPSEQFHENVSNLIDTTPNINDLRQLRSRADNIVANGMFLDTIKEAAYDYAMGTAKREMKADPYALASYNNSLDLSKGIALQNHEYGIWQQKEVFKGALEEEKLKSRLGLGDSRNVDAFLSSKGITPDILAKYGLSPNVREWTKPDFDKAGKLGLYNPGEGTAKSVSDLTGVFSAEPAYLRNGKLVIDAVDDMKNSASNYLQQSFEAMRNQYFKPTGSNAAEQGAVRAKILSNMSSILEGTGVSPEAIINGSVKTNIFGTDVSKFNRAIARAVSLQEKDVASNVVTGQWSPDALTQYQKSKQVAEGLATRRKNDHDEIMNELRATLVTKYADDPDKLKKTSVMLEAMGNGYGLVDKEEAKQRYIAASKKLYGEIPNSEFIPESIATGIKAVTGTDIRSAQQKAGEDFDRNWENNFKEYNSKVKDWYSKPGSSDTGGAVSPAKEYSFSAAGDQPLSSGYTQFKQIAEEIPNVPSVYGATGVQRVAEFENKSDKQDLANRLFERYKSGDTKDLAISYSLRSQEEGVIPKWKSEPGGELATVPQGAFMTVNLTDKTVHALYPELKKTEAIPENLKSFTVQVPVSEQTPVIGSFVSKTTPNTTEVYMRQPGATLTQSLPNTGEYVITRGNDGRLEATGKFITLDPETFAPVSRDFIPEVFDQDVSYDVAQNRWNQNMNMAKQRLEYLKQQALTLKNQENAGTAK